MAYVSEGRAAQWDFFNPVRVVFGSGTLERLPELVGGRRALLLTSRGSTQRGLTERVVRLIESNVVHVMEDVKSNPDLDVLLERGRVLSDVGIEVIVAIGGGSVIDTGKALSAMLSLRHKGFDLRTYLEGGGPDIRGENRVPVIAAPTTAGTGSEVTPFATVWDLRLRKKYSLSGPLLFPETALVDPVNTLSLPREVTIATGLDAIAQAFEAVWNKNATPITTMFATEALRHALFTIEPLTNELHNLELRERMAWASLMAGLAISRTRTALAHSMSYPITAHFGVPHGLACGFTLPSILEYNYAVDDGRLEKLSRSLGFPGVEELSAYLQDLLLSLRVLDLLDTYVPQFDALLGVVGEMFTPNRASNNLRTVDEDSLRMIVHRAWTCHGKRANST